MKLGEALSLRAKQGQRLNDLRGRIRSNALVQEGDEAPEDVEELLTEFDDLSADHRDLILRINRTNVVTATSDGNMLIDLLGEREHLIRRRGALQEAVNEATLDARSSMRYMRSELRYESKIDIADFHTQIDRVVDDISALDARIQEINWATDLVES